MAACGFYNIIGQVDKELGEATLSCSVVAQYRGEGGVSEGLWETLSQGLAGPGIIAESSGAGGWESDELVCLP